MKQSRFFELRQQHKQLKAMEINEAWPYTYDEGYIHQSNPNPVKAKSRYSFKEHLSNDQKDRPSQHNNSRKLCNKTRHSTVN